MGDKVDCNNNNARDKDVMFTPKDGNYTQNKIIKVKIKTYINLEGNLIKITRKERECINWEKVEQ